ncbi:MAG: amidohydrolase family protein [Bryobacteraceae bacterium]
MAAGEPADWIYSGRYVVTMDAGRRVIENGAVATRGEHIVGVGPRAEIERRFQARRKLHRPEALITPGLINTHTHAPMSLLRGIADDLRLQEWLENYIFPAEARNVSPEFVRWGTKLACLEMMLSGTTTFVDMYYFEEQIAEATQEAGMRAVLGQTVIGFPVPDARTPQAALEVAERFLKRFQDDPLIVPAVAPHAIYTNSDEMLIACRRLADRYKAPLLIHVAETKKEREDSLRERKQTPVQALGRLGVLDGRTLAAHAIHVDAADLDVLRAKGTGVAHCPSSNMKLASGIAPVVAMLRKGLAVGLGTDGPAGSNNDFNMFEEMDLASKLQKVATDDPEALPARQAFEMATILGARAIGMEGEIGSLEPGKRADFIIVRLDRPHAIPMYDVYSHLVYALKGSDVRDVVINGASVVRDHRCLTLNIEEIRAKTREWQGRIQSSLRR